VIRTILKGLIGKRLVDLFRAIRKLFNKVIWHGSNARCDICSSNIRKWCFYGSLDKKNRVCPVCYSFGRQRFIWYCIEKNIIQLKSSHKILHIAPEISLSKKIKSIVLDDYYITGDLNEKDVDLKLDITHIEQNDEIYDLIICLHVLEHVPNDKKALSELCRVLKPGGFLVLQVPLSNNVTTYEDSSVTTSESRKRLYGQSDHLRLYGNDLGLKIESHGFHVTLLEPTKVASQEEFDYFALDLPQSSNILYDSESKIFYCKKL